MTSASTELLEADVAGAERTVPTSMDLDRPGAFRTKSKLFFVGVLGGGESEVGFLLRLCPLLLVSNEATLSAEDLRETPLRFSVRPPTDTESSSSDFGFFFFTRMDALLSLDDNLVLVVVFRRRRSSACRDDVELQTLSSSFLPDMLLYLAPKMVLSAGFCVTDDGSCLVLDSFKAGAVFYCFVRVFFEICTGPTNFQMTLFRKVQII